MKVVNNMALALVLIGALNWGCIGLFKLDIVGSLLGGMSSIISRIVFVLVGIAGIWAFSFFSKVSSND
ncbi:MAG: DUF378 domain-containing protein [Clostridia bacterium]